jgi:hypothetical protein
MVNWVNFLLDSFGLFEKIIAYVKNKGFNLNILTITLTFVMSCSTIQLTCPFVGSWFGHAISKAAQYAIDILRGRCKL